jgi:PatG Domain
MDQPGLEALAAPAYASSAEAPAGGTEGRAASFADPAPCPTCAAGAHLRGAAEPGYVYVIGKIEPRFPRPSVEKEFAQAASRAETAGLTDRQVVHQVLSERGNRYLARQMCWVMTIVGLETYILVPRDPGDLELLTDTLRSTPSPMDLDCVIGLRGPVAQPEMCGLAVPVVGFDQIYSFDRDSLIQAIPRPAKITAKDFTPAAAELFDRLMQMTDNTGVTDEHRAMNFLAVRYHTIYAAAADAFARDASLTSVDAARSRLSTTRKVVDIVFSFTNRATDVIEKLFVRVDVTDEFPFLLTKLSPYYDR